MAHPVTSRVGIRLLENSSVSHKEVHDLHNEKSNCYVDEILRARNAVGFRPVHRAPGKVATGRGRRVVGRGMAHSQA